MGNLRQLKKNIKNFCGDIASECIIAGTLIDGADEQKLADVVYKTAALQAKSLKKVSISFDKTPRDFPNKAEYNKARRAYFKKAIASLDTLFLKEAEGLIAELNQSVPKKG